MATNFDSKLNASSSGHNSTKVYAYRN